MLLRARLVLPLAAPPLKDGIVALEGRHITSVGRWADWRDRSREEAVDLGETILLPGLINAHCHLDFTDTAGLIPPPRNFVDWIKGIVTIKAQWSLDDYRRSWQRGAGMLLRSGTTTVADVEAVTQLLPEIWSATPLRVLSFREIIHLRVEPDGRQIVDEALAHLDALPAPKGRLGLSPHAPYTTTSALLQHAARAAAQRDWRLTIHLAESESEFDMFMYRSGPLHEWLKAQRDMSDCGQGSPVQHLDRAGCLSDRLLAVHVNYLGPLDAATLGRRGVHVVHCPRSHAYFGHRRFPRAELADAGVNLCLGTDSLATVRPPRQGPIELNLFSEMQTMASFAPMLDPEEILRMATVNGARALGCPGQMGELREGSLADLIAIPFTGPVSEACAAVVHHAGPVHCSMINGQWAIPPETTGQELSP